MGFCLFNSVAVGACARALPRHGLSRVTIVDFDVHHCNGTEDIFQGDPRVLMVGRSSIRCIRTAASTTLPRT
jgi:acetoin utilization deacetylase AcuC-like enzyme